jgi:hypothetical protein
MRVLFPGQVGAWHLPQGKRSWPGPNCIAALAHGDRLRGTWHDRSAEYRARAAGKHVKPGQFATIYDIKLTPLPCLLDMTDDQRPAHYRRVVREIDVAAEAANKEKGRTPMGVQAILDQDPHPRPEAPDRSPAPLVHAHDDEKRDEYPTAYRVFVINFRAGTFLRGAPCFGTFLRAAIFPLLYEPGNTSTILAAAPFTTQAI